MNAMRVLRTTPAALALAAVLAACGGSSNEHDPSPARAGVPQAEEPFLGYADPADAATTDLSLTTSAEYDPAQNLVRLFAVVRDQDAQRVSVLNKDNFVVTLNPTIGATRLPSESMGITTESVGEEIVALVLDSSGSMEAPASPGNPNDSTTRLQAGQAAARSFVENMRGGRAAIVTFNSDARTVQPLTGDRAALEQAINSLAPGGATNFGAAIGQAVGAVGTRPGKRAMVLMTDGDDTVDSVTGGPSAWFGNAQSSRYQGLKLAIDNDFRIYTVGLGTDLSDVGTADLQRIAAETGGQYFPAPDVASLTTAFTVTIPGEIAAMDPVETYVLSFLNPLPVRAGKEVAYLATVLYPNAHGTLFDKSSGTYLFP